jgi:hypothetical protein
MSTDREHQIDLLPLLSRGKHRRPRKGACFMEFASYLAGERWSDHPACTHPLLAELARQVNDHTSDRARQALVGLVPDVIGVTGSDLHIDARIALCCARTALPVVAEERQRIMATAVLACERLLADLDGRPAAPLSQQSRDALAAAAVAAEWARRYSRDIAISRRAFRRETAPTIVGGAVHGIARSCVPDPDLLLHDLLTGVIQECRTLCAAPNGPSRPPTRMPLADSRPSPPWPTAEPARHGR